MTCNKILIHEKDGSKLRGFIISDNVKDTNYYLIVDEKHNIRDVNETYYTYDEGIELKI